MRSWAFVVGAAASVAGCGNTVDTSSPQAYAASVQKITQSLSPNERTDFQHALVVLAFNAPDPSNAGLFTNADPTSPVFLAAADKIKGKTGRDIIKLGYQAQVQAINDAIATDMTAVQRATAERQKNAAVFNNIHIDNARYKAPTNIISMREPELSFDISNGSRLPIKAIYLHGVLQSPGRSIPWISSDVNYEFEGGLEPGEHQHLDLGPNQFGDWAAKDTFANRADLELTLTVENVEGPDGTKLVHEDADDLDAKKEDAAQKEKLRQDVQAKLAAL